MVVPFKLNLTPVDLRFPLVGGFPFRKGTCRQNPKCASQPVLVPDKEDLGENLQLEQLHVVPEQDGNVGLHRGCFLREGIEVHTAKRPPCQMPTELLNCRGVRSVEVDCREESPLPRSFVCFGIRKILVEHTGEGIIDKIRRVFKIRNLPPLFGVEGPMENEEGNGRFTSDGDVDGVRKTRDEISNSKEFILIPGRTSTGSLMERYSCLLCTNDWLHRVDDERRCRFCVSTLVFPHDRLENDLHAVLVLRHKSRRCDITAKLRFLLSRLPSIRRRRRRT